MPGGLGCEQLCDCIAQYIKQVGIMEVLEESEWESNPFLPSLSCLHIQTIHFKVATLTFLFRDWLTVLFQAEATY